MNTEIMVSEKNIKMFKLAVIFLCLSFLLASCKNKNENDNDAPPPLYPQPKTIALNTSGGYSISPVSGDSIKPIINSLGGIVKTGEPIQATGKIINLDSVAKPKKLFVKNPPSVPLVSNIFNITSKPTTINIEEDKLKKFIIGKDTSSFVFLNSTGDTVLTGSPIRAKGKIVHCLQPPPVAALPMRSKDGAAFDIRYLDVDQGLSSSNIFSIIEDSFGNLWFATYGGGVCRYDGESFVHYTEKEGLSNNSVLDMTQDKNGNLWFGTEGNGICRYDGEKFIRYTEKEGLNNNFVRKIVADKKGNLWIGTEHGGVTCFRPDENGEAGTFIHYNKKEGLTDKGVFSLAEDKYGDIWLGTRKGGMCRLNMNETGKAESMTIFTEKEGFCSNGIWDIKEDSNGDLWFGTNGEGLSRYVSTAKRSGGQLTKFTTKEGLSNNSVWTIMQDRQNNLWLGTLGGGTNKYQPGKNAKPGSFTHFTDKEGLSNNEIWALKEDKHGSIWIGTFGAGVNRLNNHGFVHYTKNEGLCDNKVWAIKEDKQHNLWLGTWGDGLNKLIPGDNGGRLVFYGEQNGLPDNSIVAIVQDKKENFWFANWRSGATYFEPEKNGNGGTFTLYAEKEGLPKFQVYAMLEDKKGNIWISTWGGGIVRFDGKTFIHYTEEQGLGNNIVYCIAEDSQGNIWFGTEGGGASRFHPADDGKTGTFTNFTQKEGLSFNNVFAILEDKKGNIWIGTEGGGVSCFKQSADGKTGSFTNYTVKEGLSNNVVNSILEDRQGNLWMGTDKGLDHFVFENGSTKIYYYNNDDGLKAMDFTPQSAILDYNNQAWWGTGKSLVKLDLNNYQPGNYPLNVLLKELDINGKHIDYRNDKDSLGYKISFKEVQPFYNYPVNPVLPFFCNYLTFHFAAADLAYPDKIKYSYKLKGFSDEWSPLSHESKAEFRNLKHGDYVFMVRAIGQSQQWSNALSYPFTIRPPWWLTWWAWCLYVLAALALLRWYIFYRSRLLKEENTLLEEKVSLRTNQLQRQTAELEESLNNLKSTQDQLIQSEKMASLGELTAGIAHEIQNPLNFVNNFSDINSELIDELKQELTTGNKEQAINLANDIKENENKIHHHGKRAESIVKGMLQHSRNSTEIKEPTDINALCDEYLRLSYHGLRAKDKSFNATMKTDFDAAVKKVNIIPQDIGRVILNLLTNAFYAVQQKQKELALEKSSFENLTSLYEPTVSISTKKVEDQVEIRVTDNGNGIPQKVMDKIFHPFFTTKPTGQGTGLGLSLSYDIIKAHGGELKVETKEGEKTDFIIMLPM